MRYSPKALSRVLFSLTLASFASTACVQRQASSEHELDGSVVKNIQAQDGVYDNATDGSPVFYLINNARRTLDLEVYEMNDPDFRQAVINAQRRGVFTRIVIEPQPVGVCNTFKELAPKAKNNCIARHEMVEELERAGVRVVPFSKELCAQGDRCYQHGKMVIADGEAALMSTGNFNSSSFCSMKARPSTCNRDYSVVTRDPEIVRSLKQTFNGDFNGQVDGLENAINSPVRQKLTVAPRASNEFLGFINGAQRSIKIQAQYLKEPSVNAALISAARRGVKVQALIASNCSFTTYLKDNERENIRGHYQPLLDAGIELNFYTKRNSIKGRPAYMHAKLMIVDDNRAWVGSINGSSMSLYSNREFGMFFQNTEWVDKVEKIFEQDYYSEHNEALEPNLRCEKESQADSVAAAEVDAD